ncbi:uncharacterized protein DS421_17g577180 [Arachis hypogaea]|nr:uncharacterized protein DS421_17g577180 [Arachis hypogaea]
MMRSTTKVPEAATDLIHMEVWIGIQVELDLERFHTGVVVECVPFFVGLEQKQIQRDYFLDIQTIIPLGIDGVDFLCAQMA